MKFLEFRPVGTVLFSMAALGMAHGQSSAPAPVPHQPLVSRAPDGSWTITYSYKNVAHPKQNGTNAIPAPPSDQVVATHVEKKGATYHIIIATAGGHREDCWSVDGSEISKDERSNRYAQLGPGSPLYVDFRSSDFDELTWIGMDNYKGVEDNPSQSKVFVFEAKNVERRRTGEESATDGDLGTTVQNLGMVGPKGDKKEAIKKLLAMHFGDTSSRALLDAATQLPISYDNGLATLTYTYSSVPLVVPNDVLETFRGIKEELRRATRPAPQP